MRCFQSFFKRTWRPQQVHQMDPPSRFEPTKTAEFYHIGETELGELRVTATLPTSSIATSTPAAAAAAATAAAAAAAAAATTTTTTTTTSLRVLPCRNGGCKVLRSRGEPRSESPWHMLKTVFLVSAIVAFLLWILVYTMLDQYRILPRSGMTSLSRTSSGPETSGGRPTSARDRETQMQRHQSEQRLTRSNEEPDDNFSATSDRGESSRVIVVGWDSLRSRLMLFLIACLVIWACIFFPMLDT